MNYEITVNQLNKEDGNIRAFASVVFEESFKVSNIAVIENRDGQCFVSMPRYASSKDDSGYKDICHPITKEFREELYEGIMKAYEQVQQIEENRLQLKISQVDQEKSQELKFNVKVTPFERDGSNIRGLARIYLEDCFVINNVSLLQGKNGLFVAMPSYKTKQTDEQGKSIYQDICFPVTKEFREKLYGAVRKSFEESKEKQKSGLVIASRIQRKVNDIAICEFTNRDVVRHKLVQDIIRAYEAAEQKQAHRKPEHTDRKDAGKH